MGQGGNTSDRDGPARLTVSSWAKILFGLVVLLAAYQLLFGTSGANTGGGAVPNPPGAAGLPLPPPTRAPPRPVNEAVLRNVCLLVASCGTPAEEIGRAILDSPALTAVPSKTGHRLQTPRNLYPRHQSRAEIRCREGDQPAAAAAAEIMSVLTGIAGDLGMSSEQRNYLTRMKPMIHYVEDDPIKLLEGQGAPSGMIPVLIVLIR